MPHPSPLLSAFARRDSIDKLMFGFVQGVLAGVPNTTVQKAVAMFAVKFSLPPDQFNIETQRVRYDRMVSEFYQEQRTPNERKEG